MPNAESSGPSIDVQHQLEAANVQWVLYAHDLNCIAVAERQKASKLNAAYQQLQIYTRDWKTVFNAEHSNAQEREKAYHDALRSHRTHNPAFDRPKTCGMTLYGDGRTRTEHFDPRLIRRFTPEVRGYRLLSAWRNRSWRLRRRRGTARLAGRT